MIPCSHLFVSYSWDRLLCLLIILLYNIKRILFSEMYYFIRICNFLAEINAEEFENMRREWPKSHYEFCILFAIELQLKCSTYKKC